MSRVLLTAVAGAVAVIAAAGTASADPPRCGERGGAHICQKPGHVSLHSEPPTYGGMPSARGLFDPSWMPGFGRLAGVSPPSR